MIGCGRIENGLSESGEEMDLLRRVRRNRSRAWGGAASVRIGTHGGGLEMAEQSFQSHAKWVPPFHFFVLPVLLINIGFQIYWCVKGFSVSSVVSLLMAVAIFVGIGTARGMVLKVQDRLIRLEERLRFERVLPADMHARISEFTIDQLVALRFASNAELPELARKVLEEKIVDRKAIKQLIKTWRPDFARA
jgi:hypothetical protein